MKHIRLLCLLLSLCLLAACTAPQVPANVPPADDGAVQETLQPEADTADPAPEATTLCLAWSAEDSLNPYRSQSLVNRQLEELLYEGLFYLDAEQQAVPLLCERFERAANGMTYTFYLRSGIRLHSGAELTVEDVIASFEAARNSERYGYRLRHVSSVLSVEAGAVTLQLDTPYEDLTCLLDIPIISAASLSEDVPDGTGPYRLQGSTLARFDSWWGGEAQLGASISLYEAVSAAALHEAFTAQELTLVCVDPNGLNSPVYHGSYALYARPTRTLQYLGFNTQGGIFQSQALRSALTYIIDRDALVSGSCGSFATATTLPAPPDWHGYDPILAADYSFDPSAFQSALSAASIADTDGDGVLEIPLGTERLRGEAVFLVCSSYPQRVQAAREIAETLAGFGLQLEVTALAPEQYAAALQAGQFDLYYGEVTLGPDYDLSAFFTEDGALSFGGLQSEAMQLLCQQALENSGNYYTLHKAVLDEGLLVPLLFKLDAVYVQQGALTLAPTATELLRSCLQEEAS